MCIIAYSPGDAGVLSSERFNTMMENNPDGLGLMYVKDGEFKVIKTLLRGDVVYKEYVKAHEQGLNCALHFRITTHGATVAENCHPFRVDDSQMLMHNGVIRYLDMDKGDVDSQVFAETVLALMPAGWRDMVNVVNVLEEFLSGSKVVVMDRSGQVTILNERSGNWQKDDGIWYSNYSWKTYKKSNVQSSQFQSKKTYRWPHEQYDFSNVHTKKSKKGKKKNVQSSKSNTPPAFDSPVEVWDAYFEGRRSEDLHFVKKGDDRTFVDEADANAHWYPHGFRYQGYPLCTFCVPDEFLMEGTLEPVFMDKGHSFICTDCGVFVDRRSARRITALYSRITGKLLDENIEFDLDGQTLEND